MNRKSFAIFSLDRSSILDMSILYEYLLYDVMITLYKYVVYILKRNQRFSFLNWITSSLKMG
jgi:hypothetical protein